MIKRPRPVSMILFILIACLMIFSVMSCDMLYTTDTSLPVTQTPFVSPSQTPVPVISHSLITLPDGSKIIMLPDAKVQILTQPGVPPESEEITLMLLQGEIMVVPNLVADKWFTVQKPNGYSARLQGCAMTVNFSDQQNTLYVTCIAGKCEVSPDFTNYRSLTNDLSWSYQGAFPFDPVAIDFEKLFTDYSEDIPACAAAEQNQPTPQGTVGTATPEPTGTITPDLAATATEACSIFHKQFPATPCP